MTSWKFKIPGFLFFFIWHCNDLHSGPHHMTFIIYQPKFPASIYFISIRFITWSQHVKKSWCLYIYIVKASICQLLLFFFHHHFWYCPNGYDFVLDFCVHSVYQWAISTFSPYVFELWNIYISIVIIVWWLWSGRIPCCSWIFRP